MSNLKSLNFFHEKKYKNHTNINNDSNSEIEDEEAIIKKLIEDIYKVEEKINLLSNNSASKTKNEPKLKKLSELNDIKNDLLKNVSQYNNSLSLEMKKNDISSEHKKILINELEQKINENKNKLNSFNTLNFKYLPLIKNIFSNKIEDGFLSKEQIEDVLNSNNNNVTDEDELRKINKEKEVNKASQNVIKNNIFEYKIKKEQIEENLKMLEEEKDSTNDELINILSAKESIDCIMKLIIDKLIKNKNKYNINNNFSNNNNNTIDNNDEEEFDKLIEIQNVELLYLDPSKTAYRICENLYDIYDLDNNKKSNKFHNKSCTSVNSSKNRSGSYENDILNEKDNTNINYYKYHKRSGSNNISNKMSDMIKDSNVEQVSNKIINISTIRKPENNYDKKILTKLIQNEIETFLNTMNFKSSYNIEENLLNDFLYNLSMIIINKIKNIVESLNKKQKNKIENIFISSNDLMAYLCYFFKSFYYETLISNKLMFINKDYKQLKKDIKKSISDIANELTKLENKLDEIKIKEKININMIEIIKQKSNENGNKDYVNSNLSQIEMDYIQACIVLNDLISEREKLKKEIEKNNNDLIHKKEDNEIKVNKLNLEINKINNEIKEINNDIEKSTIQNNEEIINYRKIIADKFNQIKIQLNTYRNKKQNNINEFNQFLEKINDSINKKLNKSSFNYENILKDIHDKSNEKNNKNIFINGNELIINDLEKSNLEKKLLKKGKKYFYNPANPLRMMGIGINGSNSNNNFKKKLNRSMMGIDNSNNNINNIYNNLDNSSINNKSMNNNKDKKFLNKTSNNIYSQNLEETKINLNLPFHNKKSNKYDISSLPNTNNKDNDKLFNLNITELIENKKNKNRSTTNIMAKIKEIKKISHRIDNIKNNNIPNINKVFCDSKKSPFHTGNNNTSRVIIEEQLKLTNFIKHRNEKKANSHGKGNAPTLPLNSQNIFYKKLNPLTKNTFCYYRELLLENNQNIIKYNPLKNISFDTLCLSPYNFNKTNINLSKNYDFININENNKNINKIKIEDIENTVVSSNIKKIIEIFRSYSKYKDKKNFSLEEFINKEYNLIQDMEKEDIKKCTSNQNYNFSLITKKGKRLEFIICSYEEFKMWINGLAFIIKNKTELIRLNRGY